jgi:hypothetical protein
MQKNKIKTPALGAGAAGEWHLLKWTQAAGYKIVMKNSPRAAYEMRYTARAA